MSKGTFIAFEGFDEAGKSTQAELLTDATGWLYVREPHNHSGTALDLREMLTAQNAKHLAPRAESLLFAAARAQHVEEVIAPCLRSGRGVVADRFIDSSIAYQGIGLGMGVEEVARISAFSCGDTTPDLVFYVHIEWEEVLKRREASTKPKSRFDNTSEAFYRKVTSWFQHCCEFKPDTYVRVDGSLPPLRLAVEISDIIADRT